MDKMLELAESENIKVHFYDFNNPLKGIYIAKKGLPIIIGLDNSLKYDKPLLRSVMAEELGHHFTTFGDCIPKEFYNYSQRSNISSAEYRAIRWAANYLISDNDLLDAFNDFIDTPSALAEYFQVTPEVVTLRLKLFEKPI